MNLNLSGSENCTDKYDKGIKKGLFNFPSFL